MESQVRLPEGQGGEGPMTRWERRALAMIYGALLVPGGLLLLIVGSSLAYFLLRPTLPQRARLVNRHAWIALGLAVCTNAALLMLARQR